MKIYEIARQSLEPVLPPLYAHVRRTIKRELRKIPGRQRVLDVGGRKSPYTIGVDADITIIDLPRKSDVQHALNLGLTDSIVSDLKSKRSNISSFVFGDMTECDLPSESFDMVVSVEVLEHVELDDKFIANVARVLRPGGHFIMTTPNGDFVENRNPDHKRHYRRAELNDLLERYFETVTVDYAIAGGYFRKIGLRSWKLGAPIVTAMSAFGNIVNSFQSSEANIADRAIGTHHLLAVAVRHSKNT
jgi:SAM-dependent methyltransferase